MKSALLSITAFFARILPVGFKRAIYRFPPLARTLRRTLNNAAPSGMSVIRVAAGGLEGAGLELDLHLEKDYWLGTYELDLQQAIRDFVQPGSSAYDVGANIGYISLLLARACGDQGDVVAFEALPKNIERLKRNLSLNAFAHNTQVVSAAVVDEVKEVTFLVHSSTSMGKAAGSAGRDEQYQQQIHVPGISLDEYIYTQGHSRPDVVKMDIEGGEVLAVKGMQRLLKEAPPVMLVELHGHEAAHAVYAALAAAGYSFHRMQAHYPPITSEEELDWKAYLVALPSGTPVVSKGA
jgi:FkbM family methyltransferase